MKRYIPYKKRFKEDNDEYVTDPKVKKILVKLRDNDFKNELTRKELVHYIVSLHNINDKLCRKTLSAISDFFTTNTDNILSNFK